MPTIGNGSPVIDTTGICASTTSVSDVNWHCSTMETFDPESQRQKTGFVESVSTKTIGREEETTSLIEGVSIPV